MYVRWLFRRHECVRLRPKFPTENNAIGPVRRGRGNHASGRSAQIVQRCEHVPAQIRELEFVMYGLGPRAVCRPIHNSPAACQGELKIIGGFIHHEIDGIDSIAGRQCSAGIGEIHNIAVEQAMGGQGPNICAVDEGRIPDRRARMPQG